MSKIADGWLLTLNNGQMIFSPESLLVSDKEGNYVLDGDEVYVIYMIPHPQKKNQVQCVVISPKRSPERIAEIIIPKQAIVKKEKIYEDSIICTTVVKARLKDHSGLILPGDMNIPQDANVQKNPHQG